MIKLTHKAIARMAGYRVESRYTEFPNLGLKWGKYYWWEEGYYGLGKPCNSIEAAYKDCCLVNGLIEDESKP